MNHPCRRTCGTPPPYFLYSSPTFLYLQHSSCITSVPPSSPSCPIFYSCAVPYPRALHRPHVVPVELLLHPLELLRGEDGPDPLGLITRKGYRHELCNKVTKIPATDGDRAAGATWRTNNMRMYRSDVYVYKRKKPLFFRGQDLGYLYFSWSKSCFLSLFLGQDLIFIF